MGTTHRHASTAQAVLLEDWYQTNGVASSGEVAPRWQEAFQEAFQGRWEGELASFLLPCGFPSCPSCCHDHHDIATNLSWGLAKPRKKNHSDKFYSCMPKPTQIKMYLGGEFPVVVVFISLPFTTIVSIMLIFHFHLHHHRHSASELLWEKRSWKVFSQKGLQYVAHSRHTHIVYTVFKRMKKIL